MTSRWRFAALLALMMGLMPVLASAQTPVVRAVLFYSPTCPHCHQVMNDDLPPLMEHYGSQLEIVQVDITTSQGQRLYQSALLQLNVPETRRGVPNLTIGGVVLVGSDEIPRLLPGYVDQALDSGGLDWPAVPGLEAAITDGELQMFGAVALETPSTLERFGQDPIGNSLSLVVLIAMLASLVYLWRVQGDTALLASCRKMATWGVPLFAAIGLGIAGYMTYVHFADQSAVCGPIGDCSAVQQSQYSMLLGFIPVGLFGMLGYAGILAGTIGQRYLDRRRGEQSRQLVQFLIVVGTAYSIYLTFLEPFVIGATCAWCLASAIVMTSLLWLTASTGKTTKSRRRSARGRKGSRRRAYR
jgi:uncharacterized membrane protein/thiol-disulfide isomerase/thioredoxin